MRLFWLWFVFGVVISFLIRGFTSCMVKSHGHGFFYTNLHEVVWHFATHEAEWVLSSTNRVKKSVKEPIQNGFLFLFLLHIKLYTMTSSTALNVSKCPQRLPWQLIAFVRCLRSARFDIVLKGLRMVACALWRSEARRVVPWSETLHEP